MHGGDFNKTNGKFNFTKLFMHGYKFLNAISTEMKIKKRKTIYLIFWDRRINVIATIDIRDKLGKQAS